MKNKETLEEANWKVLGTQDDTFYKGAKWQKERSYSEEEVLDILDKFLTSMVKGEKTGLIEIWFEQHKKK
jgi:hypothetical protein